MFEDISEALRPNKTLLALYRFLFFNIALETANLKITDVTASNVICFVLNPMNVKVLDSKTAKHFTEIKTECSNSPFPVLFTYYPAAMIVPFTVVHTYQLLPVKTKHIEAMFCWVRQGNIHWKNPGILKAYLYRDADKSLARPGRKQATAAEDVDFHISYL